MKKNTKKKSKISKKVLAKRLIQEYLEKRNNKIFIANWKTNKKFKDIKAYAFRYNLLFGLDKVLKKLNFIIGIAPSAIGLLPVCSMMKKHAVAVAQFVTPHESGPFTGQISFNQVHEYNVNYVLVGHSETRKYLFVSDTFCRDSIRTLVKSGMRPILCVGEDYNTYENKQSKKVVMLQLMNCLKELTPEEVHQVIVVYEPIWSTGDRVASREWISGMTKFIRKSIADLFDTTTSKEVHVLYGGEVNENTASKILSISGIDGLLVGDASLKPNTFIDIIRCAPEYEYVKTLIPQKTKNRE